MRNPGPDPIHLVGVNDAFVRKLNFERVRHAQLFIVGDNQATLDWTRQRYKELVGRGEAHARPFKMYFIDRTGGKEEILKVDVEKYVQDARTESST
jgi:hypothetical protein